MTPMSAEPKTKPRPAPHRPFLIAAMLFAAGVWLGSIVRPPCLAISLCLGIYLGVSVAARGKCAVMALLVLVGAWRFSVAYQPLRLAEERALAKIRGCVAVAPFPAHWRNGHQVEFILTVDSVYRHPQWAPARGRAKVVCSSPGITWHRGDRLEILGELLSFPSAGNPGEWDSMDFWRIRGVDYLFSTRPGNVEILQRGCGCPVLNLFSRLRMRYIEMLRDFCGPRAGNFLAVLVLGAQGLMPQRDQEIFCRTGLIHLLAISGMHLSIMVLGLRHILNWLSLSWILSSALTILICSAYAILTGLHPPVVRAVLMLALYLAAPLLGRRADAVNCLGAAAFLILWCAPHELFSPGFQLSFVACFAIFQAYRDRDPAAAPKTGWPALLAATGRYLWDALYISIVASIATFPLVAYHFAMVTPFSPLLTVLFVPGITFLFAAAMLLLFSPLGIGWCGSFLSCLAESAYHSLHWLLLLLGSLPTSFSVLPPLLPALFIFYLLLAPALGNRRWTLLCLGLLAILWSGKLRALAQYEAGISVLDVGHGGAVYMKLPGDRHLLYDCGSIRTAVGKKIILPFLRSRAVTALDAVILSHYDADHFNAFGDLAAGIAVKRLIVNEAFVGRGSDILETARRYGIPVVVVKGGETLDDFPQIIFFYPGEKLPLPRSCDDNEHSLMALITLPAGRILLTGDAGPRSLAALLSQPLPRVEILQAPHHGSLCPATESMARKLRPHVVFANASRGFASEKTTSLYRRHRALVLDTSETGAIDSGCLQGKFHISCFRRESRHRP